jgi:hypothetical protein
VRLELNFKRKMEESKMQEIEHYFKNEITRLNFKSVVVNTACKRYTITKEEATEIYLSVRLKMKHSLKLKAWIYLLLGSIFLGVGLFGSFSKTGFVFYGAIVAGFGMLFTSIGYFRITLLKS